MGSIHNTRILRFLLVLSIVILTIFIYASYSTNTSLAPPHMRPSAIAAAYIGSNRSQSDSFGDANRSHSNESGNLIHAHNLKANRKPVTAPMLLGAYDMAAKKQHYREPTIDENAPGGGGDGGAANTNGGGRDEVADDEALERFVGNDLLEEQYAQNVDNTLGNISNSSTLGGAQGQQLAPQPQLQQQNQQQQQQLQQQNQLSDNNLNKIPDSDVLIPTSNLQKFIENADKILKNITIVAPSASKSAEKDAPSPKVDASPPKQVEADTDEDGEALPPSVVMTIKRGSGGEAVLVAPKGSVIKDTRSAGKLNTSTTSQGTETTQGIPTQNIYESGHMNEEIDADKICPNKGADLKLLILITSAQAHAESRLAIRQTWAHYGIRRDVSTAFILGRSTNESLNLALTQENFIYGDLIRGHFIDSYNNLTLKTISALEWVDEHCNRAKYVLKTDDDMFINVPKLLTFLDNHANEKRVIYGRLAKKWKPIRNKKSKYYVSTVQFGAPIFPPFTTGPAYVMSSDIVHELYVRSLHQVYLKLEDVFTTGIVAQQLGIKRVHVNEFLNRRIAFNPCNIRKTISVHMVKVNEQFDLWKKLLDQSTKCK